MDPVLQILHAGLGGTVQDSGRPGWRRYGVPLSGAMDEHAAAWANRLVGNASHTPVLEFLLQGAKLAVLREVWLAVTGADASANVPAWHPIRLTTGATLEFPRNLNGTWIYLAVAGGIAAPRILGSMSAYPRGNVGQTLAVGDLVMRPVAGKFQLPPGVAGQTPPPYERRNYAAPPPLRVWPGPQFDAFTPADQTRFFNQGWVVSSQSDRVGYRLDGAPLTSALPQLFSEPVRLGTIQVPENGAPIVTMRDGPTVGGYAKFGMIDPADLPWLAQCRPGQTIRFEARDGS
jgi:biotin-dependent carboxylase-like uncharacterized protein